ncbi:MAG TPA: thermonuclease family protein [Candidatus Hydrogenedentes bacterium]|nr:thermonuclease family protein [Candidatus Hydrogenedentota bacterium]
MRYPPISCVLLSFLLAAAVTHAEPREFSGKVVAVPAGDLIAVEHEGRTEEVRLYAVDCPETGQPFAGQAREFTAELALNKDVTVRALTEDNHGKTVGWVVLPENRNLNYALVEAGLTWWDLEHAKNDRELKRINAEAIETKKGLWADEAPLPPWDFRASEGMEAITYKSDEEKKPTAAALEEEVKSVSAKGDGEYTGVFNIAAPQIQEMEKLNPSELLMRHQPEAVKDESGKIIGWTAKDISQIPFAAQLGLRDGDVIRSVNGVPLGDMASIMQMAPQFKDVKRFTVEVQRGGGTVPITIQLP